MFQFRSQISASLFVNVPKVSNTGLEIEHIPPWQVSDEGRLEVGFKVATVQNQLPRYN